MEVTQSLTKILLTLAIGAVIGLERESQDRQNKSQNKSEGVHNVGIRTLSLVSLLGCVSGMVFANFLPIFILIATMFIAITICYYYLQSKFTRDVGFTTELAIVFSYIIGLIIAIEALPIQIIISLSVIIVLILSRKSDLQLAIKGIHREEIHAFISYALIALVILPFIPNKSYSLSDIPTVTQIASSFGADKIDFLQVAIINPFKIWLIVVLVTGIDMVGYLLERLIGKKSGRLIASVVGGFISSTATTIALAKESKKSNRISYLVACAILANTASFVQIFLLLGATNALLLNSAFALILSLIVAGVSIGIFLLKKDGKLPQEKVVTEIKGIKESEIFAIGPALKFAMIFLVVSIGTRVALEFFGSTGFLVASSIASLTGVDAVTINIATLTGQTIATGTALIALFLMNAVNLLGKTFYSYNQGDKKFAGLFAISSIIILSFGLVTLFI